MKLIDKKKIESLETDCIKVCKSFKKLYDLNEVVIIAREGNSLYTLTDCDDEVAKKIIEVSHKFHNEGIKRF